VPALVPAETGSNSGICGIRGSVFGVPKCEMFPKTLIGGDGGIRTLDRALQPYNGLANRRRLTGRHQKLAIALRLRAELVRVLQMRGRFAL
jgi:hypothetical protein